MRKIIEKLSAGGNLVVSLLSTVVAMVLIIYSGYIIYDTFYAERSAFASFDMLQYKPTGDKLSSNQTFEKLKEINVDTIGWITVDGTNIDYPVVQGQNDLEYANKDVYGRASLTGSIYLTAANTKDFSDAYCLIYGHHMDNGAMFGDISKYKDREYFDSHRQGLLTTSDYQYYDIHFFAIAKTDAYDSEIYGVESKTKEDFPALLDYIKSISIHYETPPINLQKIVAMSTCADETTYGRHILFGYMEPTEIVNIEEPTDSPRGNKVFGHFTGDKWALLNLICMILTIYTFLPVHILFSKFRRKKHMKDVNEYTEEIINYLKTEEENENKTDDISAGDNESETTETDNYQDKETDKANDEKAQEEQEKDKENYPYHVKRFRNRIIIGTILELIICVVSVLVFLLTEDIRLPLTVIDKWTPYMILIFALCILTDIFLMRKKKNMREEEKKEAEEENDGEREERTDLEND